MEPLTLAVPPKGDGRGSPFFYRAGPAFYQATHFEAWYQEPEDEVWWYFPVNQDVDGDGGQGLLYYRFST